MAVLIMGQDPSGKTGQGEGRSRHCMRCRDRSLSTIQVSAVAFREDDAIMARFVRDYVELLDARIAAITTSIESRNDLTAHIALLSLESTSAMVGEKELAKIVGLLRSAIERGQRALVPALVTAMSAEAFAVRDRLHQPT